MCKHEKSQKQPSFYFNKFLYWMNWVKHSFSLRVSLNNTTRYLFKISFKRRQWKIFTTVKSFVLNSLWIFQISTFFWVFSCSLKIMFYKNVSYTLLFDYKIQNRPRINKYTVTWPENNDSPLEVLKLSKAP